MLKIGQKKIGKGYPVYVIAEAGINHNGDMKIAKEMIEVASKAGADAIKFQSFSAEDLFSESANPDLFKFAQKLSLNEKQHYQLKKHADKNKIEFLSTPAGKKSIKLLEKLNVKALKIASPDITDHDLIRNSAKTKIPLIVSTGMSTLSEITSAIEIIREENCPFCILHCNSAYPTPIEDANLSTIQYLHDVFAVSVGFSDHTLGIDACLTAASLGASILEKHFTLDKNMEGPDQKLSADVKELKELVSKIRKIEKLIGSPITGITKSEKKFRNKMRKSVAAATDIKAGTRLSKSMLTSIRPGIGMTPTMIDNLLGFTIKMDVKKGTLLTSDMF